jgi:signal transduction histidine kinase/ActR/RegA family two-component response regulator
MSKTIKELEAQLAVINDEREKIDTLNELSWALQDSDLGRGLLLSQEAYQQASTGDIAPYQKGIAYSLRNLAQLNAQLANVDLALSQAFEALSLFEAMRERGAQPCLLRIIANIYLDLANYPDALVYLFKALRISQDIGELASEADVLNSLGLVYHKSGNYAQELDVYHQALDIYQKLADKNGQAMSLNRMAMAYYSGEDSSETSLAYARQSLELAQEIDNKRLVANVFHTIGDIYLEMSDYTQALHHFEQSLDIARQIGYKYIEMHSLLSLGKVFHRLKQITASISYLQQALRTAKAIDAKLIVLESHKALSKVYKSLRKFEKALNHHEKFHTIEKEVFNEKADYKLKSLQVIHKTETVQKEADSYQLKSLALEEEIHERQQIEKELREAKQAAEAANQAKSLFLANMSHELRSPLNVILGFSQLMMRSQEFSSTHQENLAIIRRSGEHLLKLINNVLDLSKIESRQLTLRKQNFDLYRLLDDLEDMFQSRSDEKGLELVFERASDLPQYIQADEVKLRQVLINFLDNAINFTKIGGVFLRVLREDGHHYENNSSVKNEGSPSSLSSMIYLSHKLIFEIEDTGPGISPEEHKHLFEPFVQTKAGHESHEGIGSGLPISQQFVRLMGGEISIESRLGVGSLFKFAVQVSAALSSHIQRTLSKPRVIGLEADQPTYRILIVDDKWNNRRLLTKLLRPLGFSVKEAANGKEALELWESWQPHLIWMDMRMPVMDGYEATKRIKSTLKGQATAVIALTASTLEEERAIVLSAGCDDFMYKPFRAADIFDMMYKHLGLRYIYSLPTDSKGSQLKVALPEALLPTDLESLPSELLLKLEEAAMQTNMTLIDELIHKIREHNPTTAMRLAFLAHEFEYGKILNVIKKNAKNKHEHQSE